MATFSQRYGYTSLEKAFEREQVSVPLRIKLWNILKVVIWDRYTPYPSADDDISNRIQELVRRLWIHYFNKDLDELPIHFNDDPYQDGIYDALKKYFFECQWYSVYDFLEAVAKDSSELLNEDIRNYLNEVLEEFNAAYRFIDTSIAETTDKNEIEAVEEALSSVESPIRSHLDAALQMLSNKKKPDYRNSIKESISAVEAACRLILEDKSIRACK